MKTKHTPGQWVATFDHATQRYCVQQAQGECKAICYMELHKFNELSALNARLIAEAPELLDTLKSVHDVINSYSHIPAIARVCCKLQAAIAAAEEVKP